MSPPRRVLVVITRRIGDVLLATPAIRSFRRAWPQAHIGALVFKGTDAVLASNPDLNEVIAVPERPAAAEHVKLHARLFRRYDIAASLLTGDRPTVYARTAGRYSAGLQGTGRKDLWKRTMLDLWLPFDDLNTHTVRMNLALAEALGVEPAPEVVVSWSEADALRAAEMTSKTEGRPYAVLHASARFNYKMWRPEGWVAVARWLSARGLAICLSGSSDADEMKYVGDIAQRIPGACNLAGQSSLGPLGCVLSRAAVYVGPDTVVTHMAAALGIPTIALFGPSNPVKWGPWPRGFDGRRNPWQRVGTQRQRNVTLVQGAGACVPCGLEGCERHIRSFSDCLQQLTPATVIASIESAIGEPAPA
jgi:heptosyltransferase-3